MSKASPRNPSKYNGSNTPEGAEGSPSDSITAIESTGPYHQHSCQNSPSQPPTPAPFLRRKPGGVFSAPDDRYCSVTPPPSMSFVSSSQQADSEAAAFTVCIVGDPRSGKSCVCNRFIYPHPDWYHEGHATAISEEDFTGPVANTDNWLYWGTVNRKWDGEKNIHLSLVEQTEFLNEATSLPFPCSKKVSITASPSVSMHSPSTSNASSAIGSNISSSSIGLSGTSTALPLKEFHSSPRLHDYLRRSTAIKLHSPGKLRYRCTDQHGNEQRFYQELSNNQGALDINGFLVIYDVSRRASCHEVLDHQHKQLAFLVDILSLIAKRKKPVVVVASKRDAVDEQCLSTVTQFLQKSADFRKIPLVEVSSHRNINVELAFSTLWRLMESNNRVRVSKMKIQSYQEAIREQDETQRRARESFVCRVSLSPAEFLTDWKTFMLRYSHQGDVCRFVDQLGSELAKETFEQFTAQKKTEIKRRHIAKLPEALSTMLLFVGPVTNQ